MPPLVRNALVATVLALAAWPSGARADSFTLLAPEEHLAFNRPESWALQYFASATMLAGMGTPRPLKVGRLVGGIELDWIPFVSASQERVGFDGTATDDLDKAPIFGRLRSTIGLPWKFTGELGYLPPIQLFGVRTGLISASLGRPVWAREGFSTGLRFYGQWGGADGDFTCPQQVVAAGNNSTANPFGCITKSKDRASLRYIGLEWSAGLRIARLRNLEPYVTLAVNWLSLAFLVGAQYGNGIVDRTQIDTNGFTVSGTAGLKYHFTKRIGLSLAAYYSPLLVQRPGLAERDEGLFNVRSLIEVSVF